MASRAVRDEPSDSNADFEHLRREGVMQYIYRKYGPRSRGTERGDAVSALPQASEGNEIVTDYCAMGSTLGRHPLALLRDRLQSCGVRNR